MLITAIEFQRAPIFLAPETSMARVRLFSLGLMVATPGALAALEKVGQRSGEFLVRHVTGDWEEVDAHDIKENELSLQYGFRLLSAYYTSAGERLWVITEAGRSSPCIFMPEEY
jgi:hypothetical protein